MRILLTGGRGCLGRRLTEKFLQAHQEVYSLVRTHSSMHQSDGLVESNIEHPTLPDQLDITIHCAAVATAVSNDFSVNIRLTQDILELSRSSRVKQFIHISSCSVFGDLDQGEKDDYSVGAPDSEYGKSKSQCEKLVKDFCHASNMPYTILRPGLIYGPHDRGAILKMIRFIDRGFFLCFGNGNNRKSMTSVELLAQIISRVVNNEKFFNDSFIVVDPRTYSVNDIIREISELLHRKPFVLRIPRTLSLILAKCIGLFQNFFPSLSDMSIGIQKLIADNPYRASKLQSELSFPLPDYFQATLAEEIQWYRSTFSGK